MIGDIIDDFDDDDDENDDLERGDIFVDLPEETASLLLEHEDDAHNAPTL